MNVEWTWLLTETGSTRVAWRYMAYHLDARLMSLDDVRKRLESTDLIPSHKPLLDGIGKTFRSLKKAGISSVEVLRIKLKTTKALIATAEASRVDAEYLVLLRRAVEGFFPKPQPLRVFDWIDQRAIAKLADAGIKNSEELHNAASACRSSLLRRTGLDSEVLSHLVSLADLLRIQWVNPTFARVLVAAGFAGASKVASADPEALYTAVLKANADSRFYKGKIGLRDMRRLAAAAAQVP